MTIRARLVLGAAIVGVLLVISVVMVVRDYSERNRLAGARAEARTLEHAIFESAALSQEYLVHRSERVRRQWRQRQTSLSAYLRNAELAGHFQPEIVRQIQGRLRSMGRAFEQLDVEMLERSAGNRAQRILVARLLADSQAVKALADQHLRAANAKASAVGHRVLFSLMALFVVTAVAFAVAAVLVGRDIVAPVLRLSRAMERMGHGDLEAPIGDGGIGEVGDLSREIERTRLRLRRKIAEERAQNQLLVHRDLELKRQAEELRRSNAELQQFAYVASHDLRSPLKGIGKLAAWIREDAQDALPESARENLAMLEQRVVRMDRLLTDLLEFSRVGRIAQEAEQVDTAHLVRESADLVSPPSGFKVEIGAAMPTLYTPRFPLQQVFQNLIANAFKHHDRDVGHITIDAEMDGAEVRFSVCDDGPGIPADYRERVFEMFQSLKRKDDNDGSGMGLTLVRKLVESQGGKIWIDPGRDRGTAMRFTWPCSTPLLEDVNHAVL